MRTPIFRALGAFSIAAILVACSGASGSTAPSQAAATSVAAAISAPSAAPPTAAMPTAALPSPTPTLRSTQEVGRVGILAPGSYRYSQSGPAVTFSVPKGWALTEAMPRHFGLRPGAFTSEDSVRIWYDMRVASRDPSCPEEADPAFGHTADDLLGAFKRRPGIDPRQAVPITIGGLDGYRTDLRIDGAWTEPCPFTDGLPAATLFIDDGTTDDPAFWGLAGYDEVIRAIVLDDGAGSNVVITIDAVDGPTLDALAAAAMPVLETFVFER